MLALRAFLVAFHLVIELRAHNWDILVEQTLNMIMTSLVSLATAVSLVAAVNLVTLVSLVIPVSLG